VDPINDTHQPDIGYLPIEVFRKEGFLHEANRILFHPLGLALEVTSMTEPSRVVTLSATLARKLEECIKDDDGPSIDDYFDADERGALLSALSRSIYYNTGGERLGRIWDCRDDPEGVAFGEDLLSAEKAEHIAELMLQRRNERRRLLGYVIQPVNNTKPVLTTTYVDPAERTTGGQPFAHPYAAEQARRAQEVDEELARAENEGMSPFELEDLCDADD